MMNWLKEKIRNWLQVERDPWTYTEQEMEEGRREFERKYFISSSEEEETHE